MAAPPDAEEDEVEAAGLPDGVLVGERVRLGPLAREVALGDVDLLVGDVDVVEEVLPHKPVVALEALRLDGVVLVEVERRHAGEVEALLAVHADEVLVDADGRGAGGEPQHDPFAGGPPLFDQARHAAGDLVRHLRSLLEDEHGDALALSAVGGRLVEAGGEVQGFGEVSHHAGDLFVEGKLGKGILPHKVRYSDERWHDLTPL